MIIMVFCSFNLQANVTDNDKPGLEIELHNTVVKASCQILTAVQNVLRPTPLPGRHHYLFTLKDLTTCYQVSIIFIFPNSSTSLCGKL